MTTTDSYRQVAMDAVAALFDEECHIESRTVGPSGSPGEDFNEKSQALEARVRALDTDSRTGTQNDTEEPHAA